MSRKLGILFFVALAAALFMTADTASGHQNYPGNTWEEWRVPWRANTSQFVSGYGFNTGTHVGGDKYALDFSHPYGTPIHAMASGSIAQVAGGVCDRSGYGLNVWALHSGGYYSRYAHLSQNYFSSGNVVIGQLIGKSGNSGNVDPLPPPCPTSSTVGSHLHFVVTTQLNCASESCAVNDQANGKTLSGYTNFDSSEGRSGHPHLSDNAGVGDICGGSNQGPGWSCTESSSIDGQHYSVFVSAYNGQGGYNGPGVPWDACGGGNAGCWWVHDWTSGYTGWVGATQDFKGSASQGAGAIMRKRTSATTWLSQAFWVHGNIWQKYLALGGAPWPNLGYPVSNEIPGTNTRSGTPYRWTWFEVGMIIWYGPTYETHGAIWSNYYSSGGPGSSLCGLPTSDVTPYLGGYVQTYQYGTISVSSSGTVVRNCP
jgi:hypothetical protein